MATPARTCRFSRVGGEGDTCSVRLSCGRSKVCVAKWAMRSDTPDMCSGANRATTIASRFMFDSATTCEESRRWLLARVRLPPNLSTTCLACPVRWTNVPNFFMTSLRWRFTRMCAYDVDTDMDPNFSKIVCDEIWGDDVLVIGRGVHECETPKRSSIMTWPAMAGVTAVLSGIM